MASIALWPKAVSGVRTPRVCLDGTWKFTLTPPHEPYDNDVDFAGWSDVQVPGELSLQGFDIESDKRYPLGCAIWEAKDDVFYLPPNVRHKQETLHNDVNGMGGWGCIWDSLGKLKPEAWHVTKTYSPIRIEQRAFALPTDAGGSGIQISNRFNHTLLSELRVEWSAGKDKGKIILPPVLPRESGAFFPPARTWKSGEELILRFYTPDGVMVDEHRLMAGQPDTVNVRPGGPAAPVRGGPSTELNEEANALTLTAGDIRLIIDKSAGSIRGFERGDDRLIIGGPHLHLTGMDPGPWRPDEKGIRVERRESGTTVAIPGACGSLEVTFLLSLAENGTLTAGYELRSRPEDQRELSEVGLSFDLPASTDRIQWERKGLWTTYPEDHIGRSRGIAWRVRPGATEQPDRLGILQPWPWKDNLRDFTLFKREDPQDGWATHDFRSMKEHVIRYSVGFHGSGSMLQVIPEGDAACRMAFGPGRDPLVHASDGDVAFDGPWDRIPLLGYNGAVWASKQAGASATVTFEGTGVRVYGLRQAGAALMRVLVDGTPWAVVDPSENSVGAQSIVELLCEIQGLPAGHHRVKLTVADSHGGTLGLNFFEVLRPASRLPAARLIVNQLWNYPQLDWGNFVRPAIRLEKGFQGRFCLLVTSA